MTYIKNIWVDQSVERPKTYDITNNSDGSVTLIDSFGIITELGTPVNADNMNHIEEGIENNDLRITAFENNDLRITALENTLNALNTVVPDYSAKVSKSKGTMYEAESDVLVTAFAGTASNTVTTKEARAGIYLYNPEGELELEAVNTSLSSSGTNAHGFVEVVVPKGWRYQIELVINGNVTNRMTAYEIPFKTVGGN